MELVIAKDIVHIIDISEEGMGDTVAYAHLPGMSVSSPFDFFVAIFQPSHPDCDFEYDERWDENGHLVNGRGCDFVTQFGDHTDWEGEWNTFWSAFFNSSEELNHIFWKELGEWEKRANSTFE